jgi:hypothetical protein
MTMRANTVRKTLPTNSLRICLDKIRNARYTFRLPESRFRSPVDGREDEKPWLFETLARNLSSEPERRSDFLTYIARNPLKRLDSKK